MRKLSAVLAIGLAGAIATPAQAAVLTWTTNLSAAQEVAPNISNSTATGFGMVQFDDTTNVLTLNLRWQGLTVGARAGHIHCCVASPPGNVAVALDLFGSLAGLGAAGSFNIVHDLDLFNPFTSGFTAANGGSALSAMTALAGAMNAGGGRAYYNIHTSTFPGGEIRGNLVVPEPATLSLLVGALGLLVAGRKFARS